MDLEKVIQENLRRVVLACNREGMAENRGIDGSEVAYNATSLHCSNLQINANSRRNPEAQQGNSSRKPIFHGTYSPGEYEVGDWKLIIESICHKTLGR